MFQFMMVPLTVLIMILSTVIVLSIVTIVINVRSAFVIVIMSRCYGSKS